MQRLNSCKTQKQPRTKKKNLWESLSFLVNLCEINKRQDNNDTDYTDLQGL